MSKAQPVLVVENDPFLRLLGVILDPEHTDPQRIVAFSDFFAHDLPDFNGWLTQLPHSRWPSSPCVPHVPKTPHKPLPSSP